MNKNKFFLAFPFSMFCEDDKDTLTKEAQSFFEKLTFLFKENRFEYYSAHERENWGEKYNSETESTKFDYEAMENCNIVICVPGYPYSGGTHIELGWASILKKKVILLLEKGVYYSPLVSGISCMTDVSIFYYKDFFKDIIPIIKKILNDIKNESNIKIIDKFLKNRGEILIDYKPIQGGNHNMLYQVNNKYFVKFKDELSVKEERLYFKGSKDYSAKLYYSSLKDKLLIYELLDAHDLEAASKVSNLIDIVFKYCKNDRVTSIKGFGYYGIENPTWIDFLNQEVNVSKDYLANVVSKDDTKLVDKALNNIKKYKFKKRILHGDFGLHNTMITKDKKIYFIDPEVVLGDWIYDFIFYCFSDISVLKMINYKEIINMICEDECKVKSMMIIVMFNRLRRTLKYSKEDFDEYYEYWKDLGDYFND